MGSRTRVVLVGIALTVAAAGCGRSNANRTETTTSQDGSAGAVTDAGDARNDAGTDAFVYSGGAAADAGNDPNVVDASACALSDVAAESAVSNALAAQMESLFGAYASGQWPVYRGTAAAHDNASILLGYVDGQLSGDVVAVVTERQIIPTMGLELRIFTVDRQDWFWIAQDGDGPARYVSMVLSQDSWGGVYGTTDTLPALGGQPSSIAFDAHATGMWGTGEPLVVDAQASLTRVPPDQVTFADVEFLDHNRGLPEFVAVGAEFVHHVDTAIAVATCAPPGSGFAGNECQYEVPYAADLFVAADDVTTYGFRNVTLASGQVCCSHCDTPMTEVCGEGYRYECYP